MKIPPRIEKALKELLVNNLQVMADDEFTGPEASGALEILAEDIESDVAAEEDILTAIEWVEL
jgi:hypothetical protein